MAKFIWNLDSLY